MDDFGLLVGRHFTSFPSLSNTQLSELMLDSSGRLIISGRFLEDSAHSSGDAGLHVLAVRRDADTSLVDTDGDYAPLQVDENGRLKVVADIEIANGHEKAEDSAHVSADIGSYVLTVRADTRPTNANTSADGDYASLFVNNSGELYVHDVDANASLDAIESDVDTIRTEIESITHNEDSAHSSGDAGVMSLAVRRDADTSLVNADGDYAPLQVDSIGRLKVIADLDNVVNGSEQYTVTDALAAAGDGLATITAVATPWVTVASYSHTSGTAYVYGWQWGCDQNADARIITTDGVDTVVYKRSVNSSAQPSYSEHWSEGGRIEIPGSAGLEIRIEIKKRAAPGGDANGTGSLHLRAI
jgi:hypothetical protein